MIGVIKNKKRLIFIAIGCLYIVSTPLFSNHFIQLVEGNGHNDYKKPISTIDSADAIVVLSGMLEINELGDTSYVEWGDPDRFFGGIALFKAGKAKKLVFTGGRMPWNKTKKTEGAVLKEYAIGTGIASENIFVTTDVENTADEAKAVKKLISPSKRIILVTSAFHMNRAQRLFEQQGFVVIPYKVDYKSERNKGITIFDFLPSAKYLKNVETGLRELFGRIVETLKS